MRYRAAMCTKANGDPCLVMVSEEEWNEGSEEVEFNDWEWFLKPGWKANTTFFCDIVGDGVHDHLLPSTLIED